MIYFRCDASHEAGLGHLKRCLILAEKLTKLCPVCFLIADRDKTIQNLIIDTGAKLHFVPEGVLYADEIDHYPKDAKNIILDLGHRKNLKNTDALVQYMRKLDDKGYRIIMIDGLDDDAFRDPRAPKIKALVQPYWGTKEESAPHAEHWLHGSSYILLNKIYDGAYQKRDTAKIKKILITFGGADPQKNTSRVLEGLKNSSDYEIRVIIGQFFTEQHKERIKALENKNISIFEAPDNLLEHYKWADIGICGSGTSRYEAAACGLPIIFVSIYPEHQELSKRFAKYRTSIYKGYYEDLSPDDWSNALIELQNDPLAYINMIEAIEKLQKVGSGSENLADAVIRIFEE